MFLLASLSLPFLSGCSKKTVQQIPATSTVETATTEEQQQDCLDAARQSLGVKAQVLRCGELNTPGVQEVLAVLPAKYPRGGYSGLPIWKLVILRHEGSGWRRALVASRDIQNEAGYVGADYIDDYFHFMGYQLNLADSRSDGKKAFDVDLVCIERPDGGSDQTSVEIAWNPVVGRYQEWAYGQDPEGFRPEIKNPPHWKPGVKLPPSNPR